MNQHLFCETKTDAVLSFFAARRKKMMKNGVGETAMTVRETSSYQVLAVAVLEATRTKWCTNDIPQAPLKAKIQLLRRTVPLHPVVED
jgi:hypothetical protein